MTDPFLAPVQGRKPLTVTAAMNAAKRSLETVRVLVVGEVSEFNDKPGYKAAYFTIADKDASMPCLMWRDRYEASGVVLRTGMLVELEGFFTAYAAKGRMQFSVNELRIAGQGDLRLRVAQLAEKLRLEGLMEAARKRDLPRCPERIALVTSPRGKAVHDVLRTLRRRYPLAEIMLAGVQVEGAGAVESIIEGIEVALRADPDVLLLVRGGGSYEDLMPFNDERIARVVAASPVPVVTGIGHEPDTSIVDMVCDLRASTPTAAAEAVAPSRAELDRLTASLRHRLGRALLDSVVRLGHRIDRIADRPLFTDPMALLGPASQSIDLMEERLKRSIPERMRRDSDRVDALRGRLVRSAPRLLVTPENRMRLAAARLHDLSPLGTVARGYALAEHPGGGVVTRITDVDVGDRLDVRVSDGRIGCVVQSIEEHDVSAERGRADG